MEQKMTEASGLRKYILGRFQWRDEEFELVNWRFVDQAQKGCTESEYIKISKLMFDWVNSRHQKAKLNR